MLCRVLRPFKADRALAAGEVVDASEWRPQNLRSLLNLRYVEAVPADTEPRKRKEK